MSIDLHIHSTASDGTDPPHTIPAIAASKNLHAIALTDHDTTAGIPACRDAAHAINLNFIPGIEISVSPTLPGAESDDNDKPPTGTMHILGYNIKHDDPQLLEIIDILQSARNDRNPQIIAKLNELGVNITLEQVQALAPNAVIGRPHIAAVLKRQGYVKTIQDAFKRYIGLNAPAYQRTDRLPAYRAIHAIHAAGGHAVLAHPPQLKYDSDQHLEQILDQLTALGLDGIEVYHPDITPGDRDFYTELAQQFNLITTGGSDYHGKNKSIPLASQNVPAHLYEQLTSKSPHTQS